MLSSAPDSRFINTLRSRCSSVARFVRLFVYGQGKQLPCYYPTARAGVFWDIDIFNPAASLDMHSDAAGPSLRTCAVLSWATLSAIKSKQGFVEPPEKAIQYAYPDKTARMRRLDWSFVGRPIFS
ncbi:hypothetical protein DPMN_104338 [Dreissena polymorpha]|uniref:Uncharacterized protein n=1 Tax=Dreissena polymorpha TaxID=45954 RepID=A0A9D4HFK6_DREPO|nr:hypothetical protein DPMN_104338 [Dreissena polymorpha]